MTTPSRSHGSAPGNETTSAADVASPAEDPAMIRRLAEALRGIRFGSVLAIVQDGVVVQIERTEKTRFRR
jgi:hypothetical protein